MPAQGAQPHWMAHPPQEAGVGLLGRLGWALETGVGLLGRLGGGHREVGRWVFLFSAQRPWKNGGSPAQPAGIPDLVPDLAWRPATWGAIPDGLSPRSEQMPSVDGHLAQTAQELQAVPLGEASNCS